jgi:hypothetical protein
MRIKIVGFNLKKSNDCGGFQKPKGHLDTQMFPECEGTPCDRNIVKKTVEKRKKKVKKEKKSEATEAQECVSCMIKQTSTNTSIDNKFNLKQYKLAKFTPFPPATYAYHINLDERGSFYADVRNQNGNTVFEIKAGNELGENESSIFEDGYMKHKNDIEGLRNHLIELGIMNKNQTLIMGQ